MEIIDQKEKVIFKTHSGLISANISQYNERIESYLVQNHVFEELELDISNTDNIDSHGVSFIVGLYKACLREGKQFKVSGSGEDIVQLFKLMKLEEFFDID